MSISVGYNWPLGAWRRGGRWSGLLVGSSGGDLWGTSADGDCGVVLGIDSQAAARKLVKVLLAESSAPVEDWEERFEALGRDEGRAFLVR